MTKIQLGPLHSYSIRLLLTYGTYTLQQIINDTEMVV